MRRRRLLNGSRFFFFYLRETVNANAGGIARLAIHQREYSRYVSKNLFMAEYLARAYKN